MKKLIACALAALALAVAAPVTAQAWESPQGNVRSNTLEVTSPAGVPVRVAAAANGSGQLTVTNVSEGTDEAVRAENAPDLAELEAEGYTEIGSFRITATGDVQPPYSFSYNLGAEYANADVTVYIEHEEEGVDDEVVQKTASSDGTITFTTEHLSIHTIVAKKSSNASATTDKSSKSPQTGVSVLGAAAVTAASAAGAAGVAFSLKNRQ